MEVLLDTNFIISCFVKKIDFVEELEGMGFKPILPKEVLQELKDLSTGKVSHSDRTAINSALDYFANLKIKKVSFGQGKVDDYLIDRGNDGFYVATLDVGIKRKIPNRVVIDSSGNKLKVERD